MTTKKPKQKNALHSLWGSKARADAAERVRSVLDRRSVVQLAFDGFFHDAVSDDVIQELLDAVKPPKALAGNVGGQVREQTVLTPKWIINALGPIALDPCTTAENPTGARFTFTAEDNGLVLRWTAFNCVVDGGLVYVNPPYADLEAWLKKCCEEGTAGVRIIALVPVRTNREWWQWAATEAQEIRYCRPFAFEGHEQAFPAPLCMLAWNCRIPYIQTPPTKKYPQGQNLFI